MSTLATINNDVEAQTAGLEIGGLADLLGFHVRLAQIAIYRDFAAAITEVDLTQKQFAVMQIVAANPGPSQIDIANLLDMDRASMMAIIDRLQNRRLIERRRSKDDRRRQELYLTEEGQALLARARDLVADHEKKFTSRFSGSELKALFLALRRLHRQT